MKVALDVSAVPAQPVGAGAYIINVARALAATSAVDLHLLARRGDDPRWETIAPSATVHAEVPGPRPARLAWEQVAAPKLAARLGPDVWHGPHYTLPLRLAIPAAVTVHDTTFFEHPEWHERSKVAFFRPMTRAAVRRARAVIAVSDYTARRIAAVLAPKVGVTVIPHGVDHTRFRPAPAGDPGDLAAIVGHGVRPPYLLFGPATLEPRKDVPSLVAAFARIARAHPELRLVLAGGDGWGGAAVRDAIAASGVTTRILRLGYVPADIVAPLVRQAEAVCYPALVEGFGLPALEALACGAALVTTKGSAMEDVAGDAAVLVPPGDTDALTAALSTLLADPAERERLRTRGPAVAATYTWEASAERHLAVYEAVAAR